MPHRLQLKSGVEITVISPHTSEVFECVAKAQEAVERIVWLLEEGQECLVSWLGLTQTYKPVEIITGQLVLGYEAQTKGKSMKAIKIDKDGKAGLFACEHWQNFPPLAAAMKLTAQDLRSRGMINDIECQRMQVWEKVCGIATMEETKCLVCPHLRKVTRDHTGVFLETLDRKKRSRIIDTVGAKNFREGLLAAQRPPGSKGSGKEAAWIEAQKHAEKQSD